jgi:hypothetical protein
LVTFQHLDGRTVAARRAKTLAATFEKAMGGSRTAAQTLSIQNAAAVVVLAESCMARRLSGDPSISLEDLVRVQRLAARAVADLGLDRKREPESDHPEPGRFFRVIVKDHRKRDEEVARFRAEHGVTSDDILWVRCIIPYECRPGETAAEAYQRELREMASKKQEALDHGERPAQGLRGGSGTETIATASTPPGDEGSHS